MTVYTSICGGFEKPRSDIKCFTDSSGAFSTPRWQAKIYKVLGHLYVFEPRTLWIDGNIFLRVKPEQVEREFLPKDVDIGLMKHPYRKNVLQECDAVIQCRVETQANVNAFIAHFGKAYLESLPLYECNVIARNNTPQTIQLNLIWWSLICRWSVRDQLTFPMALAASKARVRAMNGNVRNSTLFRYKSHGT